MREEKNFYFSFVSMEFSFVRFRALEAQALCPLNHTITAVLQSKQQNLPLVYFSLYLQSRVLWSETLLQTAYMPVFPYGHIQTSEQYGAIKIFFSASVSSPMK